MRDICTVGNTILTAAQEVEQVFHQIETKSLFC